MWLITIMEHHRHLFRKHTQEQIISCVQKRQTLHDQCSSCLYLFPLFCLFFPFPPWLFDRAYMLSCVCLFATPWIIAHQAPLFMGFSKQEYWVGCHALLQGIFPTKKLNPCLLWLLHGTWILYLLSHLDHPFPFLPPSQTSRLCCYCYSEGAIVENPLREKQIIQSLFQGHHIAFCLGNLYFRAHVWVFYVEFKNPTEPLPSEPNWYLFPAFWRGFWAWGWGTSPDGSTWI